MALNSKYIVIILLAILPVIILGELCFGYTYISPLLILENSLNATQQFILLNFRLPQLLFGFMAGAALAASGTAMQSLFRNPLADPSLLGVSGGAALTTAIYIAMIRQTDSHLWLVFNTLSLGLCAFTGAILMTGMIYVMVLKNNHIVNNQNILITGFVVNGLCSAVISLLIYLVGAEKMKPLIFWEMGTLENINWIIVTISFFILPLSTMLLCLMGKSLNALALGNTAAYHLGINNYKIHLQISLLVAIATGFTVAFCGIIGFVGVIAPHIIRQISSSNNRMLLPISALLGGELVLSTNTLAKTLHPPLVIPIGIITTLCGAPIFLTMLHRAKKYD